MYKNENNKRIGVDFGSYNMWTLFKNLLNFVMLNIVTVIFYTFLLCTQIILYHLP